MDILAIIGIIAAVIGIPAAIVQVLDYLQKRRQKQGKPGEEGQPSALPTVSQVPHNLPPRSEFIGREAEKARVHEALQSRSYLVSIDGIGGIGKTVLALEVAHECLCAKRGEEPTDGIATFDGFIWTTAKDRDLTLNAFLDAIALTLEFPGIAQHPTEQKQIAVRKLLQEKPYLVIVDNFETITDEGVRGFLLNLPEPSKALITTREQKLRQVWSVSLKGLDESEALSLIRSTGKRLGLRALEQGEDRALRHLYNATGGAPLAIKWAVGQIKQRGQSLDAVLGALHEARGDIFDNIFDRSWSLLSPTARQVLITMPLFATSASRAGIEAASDVHHYALDEALGQLVEMSLAEATDELELARRRYSIHPLTRAFADARMKSAPEARRAAQSRLVGYFEEFTKEHGAFWHRVDLEHLGPELPNILAVIQWCWEQQLFEVGAGISYNIGNFLLTCGYWNVALALGKQVVEHAAEVGDEVTAAKWRVGIIGWVERHRGDLDSAEEHAKMALDALNRSGEKGFEAYTRRTLGRIAQERGEFERAEELLNQALSYFQSTDDEREIIFVTSNIAQLKLEQGDLEAAWGLSKKTLPSARRVNDSERIGHFLSIMASVARQRSGLRQAKELWEEALGHMRDAERLDETANILVELAQVEVEMGELPAARQKLSDALEIYRRLDVQFQVEKVEMLLSELPGSPGKAAERKEGRPSDDK